MLKIKIEREIERIKKEKVTTLEQLHHKFKNRKFNIEDAYKKQLSLQANPTRAKSASYKAPKLKSNSSVFSKLSSIDNLSVHTSNSKNNRVPEKINVNLSNLSKSKNTYSVNYDNDEHIEQLEMIGEDKEMQQEEV